MPSISLSWKMLFAASACLTLLACGDETSTSGDDDDSSDDSSKDDSDPTGEKDAATRVLDASEKVDASGSASPDAGRRDGAVVGPVTEGDRCDPEALGGLGRFGNLCEGCGAPVCIAPCDDDGSFGACRSAEDVLAELASDGGFDLGSLFGDAGFEFGSLFGDAGPAFGRDAGFPLPTPECPAEYSCQRGPGVPFSGNPIGACLNQAGLPATCETNDDCAAVGFTTCFDTATIPGFSILLPEGFPAKYCTSICAL